MAKIQGKVAIVYHVSIFFLVKTEDFFSQNVGVIAFFSHCSFSTPISSLSIIPLWLNSLVSNNNNFPPFQPLQGTAQGGLHKKFIHKTQ